MPDVTEVNQQAVDQSRIWVCDCGCPHFYLLMSGECECASCAAMSSDIQCFNIYDAKVKH